mgnify:CR=1 FL=1
MDLSSRQPSTMPKERRGRPRKLNARLERKLRRSIQILREREGNFTIKRLMDNACISTEDISESTISRFLKGQGYYYLQARKKGLLKKIDLKKRRIFARKMKNEYPPHVWTHDIAFYLDGTAFAYKRNPLDQALAPKARVWRKRSEGLASGCTAKGRKTGTGGRMVKLMVAISFGKGVVICKTYEKLDGRYFAGFIDENFESMFAVADKGALRLWVQDGDPSQNSAMARAAMVRANCQLLKIPARSPDLNPIENIFKLVSDALRKQAITSRITTETYEQFKARVISTIKSIPIEVINRTIASMANRVDEVIKRKGERLRY